ncbi:MULTISPECIES: alpha-(1-_3)-arabinofuranosyltransferase domain-containing protein [Actinomadura]|uniref:Alpha-(1->3)-arabinofuranosyltransferase family protein n=1 Tax=Actinomadura yumaensis TaxID=111807 RepID=A0ABW2CR56_9ACTN|nr:alpha-(1->3)-arabinofuranosyltransferase family protein [Actinomadura sp. J1-007]MWK36225.1 DUF3367 domain-containing protein [Actinomadura sp. J1-007]
MATTTAWADRLARRVDDADRDDRPPRPEVDDRLRERFRVLVCCLLLTVLATSTRPGRILADTKIDMAVNPVGFLGRALHLWDPEQFGQLQNQASGYFFPMGPFYAAGHLAGVPAWMTQRLWLALLMIAAFLGARRLAARLGAGGPVTRLLAGMAYALGPHGLSALGQNSWEYLPLAMLPWIVLPLVTAVQTDGGRLRAAARSGLAVALCGGINGAATVAVLAVPALYLLTRPRGTARLRLAAWWAAAVGCAVAWWLVPLLLTGKYGFSWLGYTEKADTTTSQASLVNVLRGAERWINYLDASSLPVGHTLSVQTVMIVVTALLAALGLAGLARRDLPERTFLLLVLLAGVAVVAAGHAGDLAGPAAGPVRDLLDGPLAPIRNLYKFDGLLRLPLAIGLAHLPGTLRRPRARLALLAVAAATLAAVGAPALSNGLAGTGDFTAVPKYWKDAAAWLNGRAGEQAVVALPGARFGDYTWGRPMDDIMQPLLNARWGARQLVPQGSPGYARVMDAIDQRVSAGQGSPGLTETLARMGVRYLLVRNDLTRADLRGAWPARVHEALETSPGIKRVAAFGDQAAGGWAGDAVGSYDQPYAPVEVYEVADADDVVGLLDADRAIRLYGAPEGMLSLADNGVLNGRPVLLDGDDPDAPAETVVSDALRWRERALGEIRSQIGPTMAGDRARSDTRGRGADPEEPGWDRYRTTAGYTGVANVTASSSASDAEAIPGLDDPGAVPYAALDRDPKSEWITGGFDGPVGQWLRVDLSAPREFAGTDGVEVAFPQNDFLGPPPSRVAVDTAAGTVEQEVQPVSGPQRLKVPAGTTGWLRVRVLALARQPAALAGARVAISDLRIDGVNAVRYLDLPAAPAPAPATGKDGKDGKAGAGAGEAPAAVMARSVPPRPECMKGSARWVCSPELGRGDEEGGTFRRRFPSPVKEAARITGTAVLTDPAAIDRLTRHGSEVTVSASSSWTRHPAGLPRSAFDGNPATTWAAAGDDRDPTLTVGWRGARRLSELTVRRPPGVTGALRLTLTGAHGEVREGLADRSGRFAFQPMTTDRLTLRLGSSQKPVQVTDLVVPGVRPLTGSGFTPFTTPCGQGPAVQVNGARARTRVTATVDEVLGGRPVRFETCGSAPSVKAGQNVVSAGGPYLVGSMVVDPGSRLGAAKQAATGPVEVRSWGKGEREVGVDAAKASYLVVNENYNRGWHAHVEGGPELRPVRLDGWRQAWAVPAGTKGTVKLSYEPDTVYRASLLVGFNLLIVLLIAAVWARPARGRPEPAPASPAAPGPAARVAALALAAALGFWLAGVPGLAATALVALASDWAQRRPGGTARGLRSVWPVVAAMTAAGALLAAAGRIGASGASADVLGDVAPQLLCLLVIGRLAGTLAAPRDPDSWLSTGVDLQWVTAPQPPRPGPSSEPSPPPAPAHPGASTRADGRFTAGPRPAPGGAPRPDRTQDHR